MVNKGIEYIFLWWQKSLLEACELVVLTNKQLIKTHLKANQIREQILYKAPERAFS